MAEVWALIGLAAVFGGIFLGALALITGGQARAGVKPALGIWWTRRKPKPERLSALCASSDILVLKADVDVPAACRDTLVLTPINFAMGGAAEVFATDKGWRVAWSAPLRGHRPWTASEG